ncbi:hypothetical protein COV53_02120 [Candidatus Gottesmanbacteria bacterium CG11_big_fil_rev_8_21_14_0_20_37_11]|uniref:PqqD family protein n=3 Tax=Candidatus Gottesmaniibacteriota TaxID=1752720 RepID=A0A2M7RQH3_9BACT|nr:MAG: hypothetical protein COV53_02120 [Candidatus Gottesmanbacteria bacterium CG11_big_fil_rev_8_21_14_0_20_37_11]PIZ02289.1 MAG: hypothetical protein COY59_05545 [Candidatus Gottesmanbacteria bacterium CG_4_10_14_0_8_um_filter_37_24]
MMKKYKINKGFIIQKLDGKTTIFDGEESLLYTFNETASFIFDKIKLGWNETKIATVLGKKFQVDLETTNRDISGLVKELIKKKIISSSS